MKVRRIQREEEREVTFELLDDADHAVEVVSGFMRHLAARCYSPNTLSAYGGIFLHFGDTVEFSIENSTVSPK